MMMASIPSYTAKKEDKEKEEVKPISNEDLFKMMGDGNGIGA
jgi:hypothetical protein